MRTVVEETQVYSFNELPEESQEKVFENYRDWNVEGIPWWEDTCGFWKEKLASIGFEDAEIQFSGFWSQGDGASFTASVDFLNLLPTYIEYALQPGSKQARRLTALAETGYFDGAWSIERTSNYYVHENTVSVSCNTYHLTCLSEAEIKEIEETIQEIARGYMQEIYSGLEAEYEYLTSDDCLREYFSESDYEFTSDGKLY